jgi:hypothetical protein
VKNSKERRELDQAKLSRDWWRESCGPPELRLLQKFVGEEDDAGECRRRSREMVRPWAEGEQRSASLAWKKARAPQCVSAELLRRSTVERQAAARRAQETERLAKGYVRA